jgi:ABC-type sugar transport system ATPase subunit
VAVLLVSSVLPELRVVCDRFAVRRRGLLVETLARDAATDERLGALMTAASAANAASAAPPGAAGAA